MRKAARFLYTIIGPTYSTKLATSFFGKLFFKIINLGKGEMDVYKAKYNLKLKLTKAEAQTLGISFLGEINPEETDLMVKYIKEGDTIVDVGAYVDGWYSLIASKLVGPTGRIISFEPHPDFFERLKDNIKLNNLTNNIELINKAVGEKKGKASLIENAGATRMAKTGSLQVDVITLDSMNIKPNFIKLDVEGFETQVIRGALKILKKYRPILLVEVIDKQLKDAGSSKKELINTLLALGYRKTAELTKESINTMFVPTKKQ